MENVFIGLGSNIGQKALNIKKAIKLIGEDISGVCLKCSSLFSSPPWGVEDQEEFVNSVILIKTDLSAKELLAKLLLIEEKMGRIREKKWGPRIIDLDIIFYGSKIIKEEGLNVPHPYMHVRAFVLKPMAQLNDDFIHPEINKSIKELMNEIKEEAEKVKCLA